MTAVNVRLPETAYARLRHEAFRRRSTVPSLLAELAERAAEVLPDPTPRARRPLAVVLRERVAAHLAAGLTADEIAVRLGVPAERVQRVLAELQP
jgi:hypothetical protein